MRDNLPNMLRAAAKEWRKENKVVATGATRYDAALDEAADAIEELSKQVELEHQSGFADGQIAANRKKLRWIPVTERLPAKGTNVLVCEFGRVEQAYTTTYTADRSLCWVVINGGSYHRISDADCPIKWWMPLPTPPTAEEDE